LKRIPVNGELVTFQNSNGFHHDGILYISNKSKKTIIHIHGSYGNFYQNFFHRVMAKIYTDNGYNFLSFNLTSHDGFAEGYKGESDFLYVGGAVSDFLTCVSDIEGAVQFVGKFSDTIILQGHSLGCDRVVHYLLNSNQKFDFILLSPCDSYKLQSKWVEPYTVEQQIKRIKLENKSIQDFDWLPIKEYGVYSANEEYIIPITRKSLLSIMNGPPFKLFNISKPCEFFIDQNCFIYIGTKDNLQTETPDTMFDYFKKRVLTLEPCLIENGDHMLKGQEDIVAKGIIDWLKKLYS
jgi:hypothetical protein